MNSFDLDDPRNDIVEDLRIKIVDIAIAMQEDPRVADLPEDDRLECFIMGAMTGVMGSVQAMVMPESYEAIEEVVRIYVSSASAAALEVTPGRYDG